MRTSIKEIDKEQAKIRHEYKLLVARIDETEKALRQAYMDFAVVRDIVEKYTKKRIHEWPKYMSGCFVKPQGRIEKVLYKKTVHTKNKEGIQK